MTLYRHAAAHLVRRAISYRSNTEETEEVCRQLESGPHLILNAPTSSPSAKDQKHLQGTETTEWTHRANTPHRQLPTVKLHQQIVSRLIGETKILFNMSDWHNTSKASRDRWSCFSAFQSQGQRERWAKPKWSVGHFERHPWDSRTNGWRTCQTGNLTD